jgi:UPF0716 family protein affecting phage T7 exclusion
MFYLMFAIFSVGTAMLQTAHLRAPKGIVPTQRRRLYTAAAAVATLVQILAGWLLINPGFVGALLFVPIFYAVNQSLQNINLRLRYTFRVGLGLVLVTAYWVIHPIISEVLNARSI